MRANASITQSELERFFTRRIGRASGDYWFFDTTSVSSYSTLLERVRWGRNKDHTPLPQINLAVVKDTISGAPLAFKDLPGNITDVTLVKPLLTDFTRLGAGRMKLCMDRGFYSKTNIDALMGEHMKFLIAVSTRIGFVAQALTEHTYQLGSWEHYAPAVGVHAMRVDHPWAFYRHHRRAEDETSVKRSYLHLYYDPDRAINDGRDFTSLINQLHQELTSGDTTEDHRQLYKRYFRKVRGGWTGIDQAIAAERARHGHFALLSNDATLDSWQALSLYRAKDQIEKAFHDVKDRLDTRTTRTHNQQTLTGKLLTVFTALILTTELRRRITTSGLDQHHTLTNILDQLETIEQYQQPGHRPRILHTTQKQHNLYTTLGVNPPTTSQ